MTKQTTILALGALAIVGYFLYKKEWKSLSMMPPRRRRRTTQSFVGANNFFQSHSQNCSGLNCI
jgi:hypothetical protein